MEFTPLKKSRQEFDTWQKKFLEKHKTKDYTGMSDREFYQLNYQKRVIITFKFVITDCSI